MTWRGQTDAERGFARQLKKLRPDTTFKYIDAARSKVLLGYRLHEIDISSFDLVYSFGTTGTKVVSAVLHKRVPQVFNIVANPTRSKIVKSIRKPGNNITGAEAVLNMELQLQVLLKLKDIKTVGVWFDPREAQSTVVLARMLELGEKYSIKVKPFRIIPDAPAGIFNKQISSAIRESNKLDAIYLSPASSFFSMFRKHFSKLNKSLLIFSPVTKFVGKGVTVSLGAKYSERGRATAELAHKILSGEEAGNIPVRNVTLQDAYLYVDTKRAAAANLGDLSRLGIKIIEVDR